MNNYSIDATVYAFNYMEIVRNEETYERELLEYAKRIHVLYDVIIKKKPRHFKYYLFLGDIINLRHWDLDFTKKDLNSLGKLSSKCKIHLDQAKVELGEIFNRLISSATTINGMAEYIAFEKWFRIDDISLRTTPELSKDIFMNDINNELRDNTIKNIAKIAALNKHVYKNLETHKIILGNNIDQNEVNISAFFFVNMKWKSLLNPDTLDEFKNINRIKNFPKKDVLQITNQRVKISTLSVLTDTRYNYSWNDNPDIWNNKFKHITFVDPECANGLKEYKEKIKCKQMEILGRYRNNIRAKLNTEEEKKDLKEIKRWKKQLMDILYINLKSMDEFLSNDPVEETRFNDVYYHDCKPECDKLLYCGAHIRYFGADCVDEKREHKKNRDVEEDRTINKSVFWLHLRPYSMSCDAALWFLGLRIHFRWITNQKIEIGKMGRHRFTPCEKRDQKTKVIKKCKRWSECPIYQDPGGSEYQNFLKEWT